MDNIPFQTIDWATVKKTGHAGQTGQATWQSIVYNGLRIRVVEYSRDYLADHWCKKGHIVYCLEGDFESELESGTKVKLSKGMSYIVSDDLSSHRSFSANGVKLLIIDGDFLKYEIPDLGQAQIDALHAHMNSHFVFNALNSIKAMILDNETKDAAKYLDQFAQLMRLTLDHSKKAFASLDETVEFLHAYLKMEQLRFGGSFSYLIETPAWKGGPAIKIPTLMIQPLAENAIWHGLLNKNGDKKITIRFMQTRDIVICVIEDNGIGIQQSEKISLPRKRPQTGLETLRNRIKIMNERYNMNCSLDITDIGEINSDQTGTMAVLRFNMLTTFKNEYI